LLDGNSILKTARWRTEVQMIFQDAATSLNPRFTARQIVAELSARKLEIDTVRLQLRETAARCLGQPDGTNGLRSALQAVEGEAYKEFVAVVLPRLLSRATSRGHHRRIVMAMMREESVDVFAERYCSLLFQRSQEAVDPCDAAALTFWLKFEDADAAWPLLGGLRERALDTMATRIATLPKRKRARVESSLRDLDELKGAAGQQKLEGFLERLASRQQSWLSRLFGSSRT